MHNDIKEIYFSETEIQNKIKDLAQKLDDVYQGEEVVFVGVLKGSLPFYIDLARAVSFPVIFDFICVSSYGRGTKSSGEPVILKDLNISIKDKHVLIVEDILDSGNTLHFLMNRMAVQQPKSMKLCCLLNKPSRRVKDIQPDFVGYDVEDEFVVGYGLDYNEQYRQLPYIGILKREIYENL